MGSGTAAPFFVMVWKLRCQGDWSLRGLVRSRWVVFNRQSSELLMGVVASSCPGPCSQDTAAGRLEHRVGGSPLAPPRSPVWGLHLAHPLPLPLVPHPHDLLFPDPISALASRPLS